MKSLLLIIKYTIHTGGDSMPHSQQKNNIEYDLVTHKTIIYFSIFLTTIIYVE